MDKDKRNKKDKYLNIMTIITIIIQIGCFAGLIFFQDKIQYLSFLSKL